MPKPAEGTKRAQGQKQRTTSRLDEMKAKKIAPQMPPNPLPHLISNLLEIGLTEAAGMGAGPISWGSINQWQAGTGRQLQPWEVRLIRQLSITYVAFGRKAEAETCPPPWRAEVSKEDIAAEVAGLNAVLG